MFTLCLSHVSKFIASNIIKTDIIIGFNSCCEYLTANIAACQIVKPATPINEPILPHSVSAIYKSTAQKYAATIKKYHQQSQGIEKRNNPIVEAIPLPPLNLIVTGNT